MSEPYWVPLGAAPAPPAVPGIERIFDTTLGAAASEILISSIPQTYAHLKLVGSLRGDNAATQLGLRFQFNGDTAANYDAEVLQASGATAAGLESVGAAFIDAVSCLTGGTAPAARFTSLDGTIPHYTSAVSAKILTAQMGQQIAVGTGGNVPRLLAGIWRTSNAPITSIRVFPSAGNLVAGSRLTLYGLI